MTTSAFSDAGNARQAAPPTAMAQTSADAAPATTRNPAKTIATEASDCAMPALQAVLNDVSSRFGAVKVVATNDQKTHNHIAGSAREKLHHDCKAIDFRPDRDRIDEVKAYLRTRSEIAGIESYRDGVVHMDLASSPVAAARTRKPAAVAQARPRQAAPAASDE